MPAPAIAGIATELLVSDANPDGWAVDELLARLRTELESSCARWTHATSISERSVSPTTRSSWRCGRRKAAIARSGHTEAGAKHHARGRRLLEALAREQVPDHREVARPVQHVLAHQLAHACHPRRTRRARFYLPRTAPDVRLESVNPWTVGLGCVPFRYGSGQPHSRFA